MMVNRVREANDAIDSIYKHCGYKTPVSNIIKHLQKERMDGTGYPQFLWGTLLLAGGFYAVTWLLPPVIFQNNVIK